MDIIYAQKLNEELVVNLKNKIKNFEVGIIPTDTIYCLCGIAISQKVKNRIYEIKQRDLAKQLVLLVGRNYDIKNLVENISIPAQKLMRKFLPGPLTLIFKASQNFIEKYNWEIETIGIRIPNHNLFLNILYELNEPIFGTSSNISGEEVNNDLDFLKNLFMDKIDFLVYDDGQYKEIPSTIVDVSTDNIVILREGVITAREIMETIKNE